MTVSSAGVVAVTRYDGKVRFWDADRGRPLGPAVTGTRTEILAASFSPDGRQLVTGVAGRPRSCCGTSASGRRLN
jgi:WD40 repeat protein